MADIVVTLPTVGPELRAIVTRKDRDIAGRGYDDTFICRLTPEQTDILRGFIAEGRLRQEEANRQAEIRMLRDEADRLEAMGPAKIGGAK